MSINTSTYRRKSFDVEGVQVTEENIYQVALWCGGTMARMLDNQRREYIYIENPNRNYKGRTKAYVGDLVLKSETGVKIYDPKAFANAFEKPAHLTDDVMTRSAEAKRARGAELFTNIYHLVKDSLINQDSATHFGDGTQGVPDAANETTRRIMRLL